MPSVPKPDPVASFEDALSIHKRETTRALWTIAGVSLLLLLVVGATALLLIPASTVANLQDGLTPPGAGEVDFLKIFVPGLAVAFGFFIGFLGLKRLEQFDSEINRLRVFLFDQIREDRNASYKAEKDLKEELKERTDSIRGEIESITSRLASQAVSLAMTEKLKEADSASSRASILLDQVNSELKPFEWLVSRRDSIDEYSGISTIEIAHRKVQELTFAGKSDEALAIAERAVADSLPGDADDFHNLSAALARLGHTKLSSLIVQNGLTLYPEDVDLLADGVKYMTAIAKMEDAKKFVARLRKIDFSRWNWRAFVFVGDHLEVAGDIDSMFEIYDSFKQHIPTDEKAYSQPGVYYQKLGRLDRAKKILTEGLDTCSECAQCAIILSEVLCELGEYREAIHAADRAVESNADEQPSANASSPLWRRAVAQDRLLHSMITVDLSSLEESDRVLIESLASGATMDYKASMSMPSVIPAFRQTGPSRVLVIQNTLAKLDIHNDVVDRIAHDTKGDSSGMQAGILQALLARVSEDVESS